MATSEKKPSRGRSKSTKSRQAKPAKEVVDVEEVKAEDVKATDQDSVQTTDDVVEVEKTEDAPSEEPSDPVLDDTLNQDTDPQQAGAEASVTKQSSGFWGLLLGGVLAAAAGFGFAKFSQTEGWFGFGTDNTALLEKLVAQDDEIDTLTVQIGELDSAKAQIEAELSETTAAQAANTDKIAGLSARLDDILSGANNTSLLSDDLNATLKAQKDEIDRLQGELGSMADFAKSQIAEAEAEKLSAAEAEARAVARGALNVLRTALNDGAPFTETLETISEAAEIPEPLAATSDDGVATEQALEADFATAAREALSVSLRETAGSTAGDKFKLFLQDQLGARSLVPQEGDDPDAVLSRAEAAMKSGDIASALSELGGLPEAGKSALSDWSARATARMNALAAFETLQSALSEN